MNPIIAAALWVLLTTAGLVVSAFPRRFELWLGPLLGRLFLLVDARRRAVAQDNIRHCLPELDADGRQRLLRENYDHYGILALELLHLFSPIPGHYRRYAERIVVFDNFDVWEAAHAKGKGTLLITGHFANWEAAGLIGARGVPIIMATRRLKPEWLNRKVVAERHSLNGETVYGKRILPLMLKHLKEGHCVGFVFDQYAPPPMGVPATFFGVKVDTQGAVGMLAQRTGAAIVLAGQRRDQDGFIHVVFEPELRLTGEQLSDPAAATEVLAARIESLIRANPAQWLWIHRRFKHVVWPGDTPA